ncbi:MAG: hypothetical protein ACM3PC_08655 [Deltaproteobacteria bacterium]
MNRRAALLLLAALALPSRAGGWKEEFEEVCSKTQDAMSLDAAELRSLIDRCDKLKPAIEALDESARKVYTRRLSACRELYVFVLETREQK